MVRALHVVREVELHVVAQVVEPEFVVGAVGDVAAVGGAAFVVVQVVDDHAHAQAQQAVDGAHPGGVALGQVIVHGHHVHALAFQRVQVAGQRGDQRLAFAGLHLGDLALVQHHAADKLHVEVPHVQRAAPRFAAEREGFRKNVVERGPVGQAFLKLVGTQGKGRVRKLLHLRFEGVDLHHPRAEPLQLALVLCPNNLAQRVLKEITHALWIASGPDTPTLPL